MKKGIILLGTLFIGTLFTTSINAQTHEYLDINNIKARINANSFLFHDPTNSTPSFEYPANSGKNTIYSARLHVLGEDVNGQLKGSIPFAINNVTLHSGPIMNNADYASAAPAWDKVWKINCSEIQLFKDWYQAGTDDQNNGTNTQATNYPGYQIPTSIINWPAHGDVSKGQALQIAPFFDTDGDSFYDPTSGDYPLIKGDQAIFFIYNDSRSSSLIPRAQTEIRGLAYAFANANDSALNNTIFINYEIINQGLFIQYNTHIGFDVDFDLGNSSDDFVGSDVARSAFYAYNGDAFDEDANGALGYGANLAAQGVVILSGGYQDSDGTDNPLTNNVQQAISTNGSVYPNAGSGYGDGIIDNEKLGLTNFMHYGNGSGAQGSPVNAWDYYEVIQSKWNDGTPLTSGGSGYGGNVTTKHAYPNTSDPLHFSSNGVVGQTAWSETNSGNPPGDRKAIGAIGPIYMPQGHTQHVEIALISARDYTGSGNQASIVILNERIDSIKSYFANGLLSDCSSGGFTTAIESHLLNNNTLQIAPNPFTNRFVVNYKAANDNAQLRIYNLMGERVLSQTIPNKTTTINLANQANGIYSITIIDGDKSISKKIVKQ